MNNIFKTIPSNVSKKFGFCVFGKVTDEVLSLADTFNLKMEEGEKYTNFFPTDKTNFSDMFPKKKFKYMDGFIELCKEINALYSTHQIVGNEENKRMFGLLLSDLDFGMKKIGMFEINKL